MITEIKKFRIKCDRCEHQVFVEDVSLPGLPKGWKSVFVGVSGYRQDFDDLCPSCLKKHDQNNKN